MRDRSKLQNDLGNTIGYEYPSGSFPSILHSLKAKQTNNAKSSPQTSAQIFREPKFAKGDALIVIGLAGLAGIVILGILYRFL